MRICVCTIVHHPEDARILHRQIRALLDAGHEVTYIAPFRDCDVTPWRELTPVNVPRSTGKSRLKALRAAHRELIRHAVHSDVVLLHDPELLVGLPRRVWRRTTVVWDVHEDTAAALSAKSWVPGPAKPILRPAVRLLEKQAERRHRLLLAEDGYRARFRKDHPVVPNTTYVSETPPAPPGDDRIVYIGHLSVARGTLDMIEMARSLAPEGIKVELVGAADPDLRPLLKEAQREGVLRWYGFVPNDRALQIAEGAMAGLALLHDEPNYRHSMPTKVVEYMARGIPVLTTPNPPAVEIVEPHGSGLVVPFADPAAAADAVRRLRDEPELRAGMARAGYEAALARFHWPVQAVPFVANLEQWAGEGDHATGRLADDLFGGAAERSTDRQRPGGDTGSAADSGPGPGPGSGSDQGSGPGAFF